MLSGGAGHNFPGAGSGRPGGVDVRASGWGFRHPGRRAWAVRGIDLAVEAGERVLLLGPSGAGKTTLLHGLAGLLGQAGGTDPDIGGDVEGQLRVGGRPPAAARDQVGLVFQDPETQLVMARAGDDVAFGLENHAVPTEQIWPRVDAALDLVRFPYGRDRPTAALSGGEKQRLVLGGVVALRPSLLLLDEPTANLDPDGGAAVRSAVGHVLVETGATLVLVEHRTADWLPFVDRVVVLDPTGGLLADGPTDAVFTDHARRLAEHGVWVPTGSAGWASGPRTIDAERRSGTTGTNGPAPIISGQGLGYRYPQLASEPVDAVDAVDGVDLDLPAGAATAISGPNGSGKSTLALLLAGLLRPDRGRVVASGRDGRPLHRWRARDLVGVVGMVFQEPEHQFLTRTVLDELLLGPRLAGLENPRAVADPLLERLGLTALAAANPFTLSGGEKRRLSVATALAAGPQALILDEPTFGQDRRTWLEILDLLTGIRDDGRAVCCVSHDRDFVAALADRELVLGPMTRSG